MQPTWLRNKEALKMRILKLPDVKNQTGMSRSTIYALMSEGEFPKQIRLKPSRSVGWLESDVQSWIAERVTPNEVAA